MARDAAEENDRIFAQDTAESLARGMWHPRFFMRGGFEVPSDFLYQVNVAVADHVGIQFDFMEVRERFALALELRKISRIFSRGYKILMFAGLENDFGLPVIVDIYNPRARRALEMMARDNDEENETQGRIPPRLSARWVETLLDRGVPLRLQEYDKAAIKFTTLFVDAVRRIAKAIKISDGPYIGRIDGDGPDGGPGSSSGFDPGSYDGGLGASVNRSLSGGPGGRGPSSGGPGSGGTGIPFTVNCNLAGYALDFWPQYNYSPRRFGAVPTFPVDGFVPTSGNYYFLGRKPGDLKTDNTPHYAGGSNTSTLVTF